MGKDEKTEKRGQKTGRKREKWRNKGAWERNFPD
jgi:hypothetical protein